MKPDQAPRKASFLASMKAVLWSFFGVRKRRDYEDDAVNLNPFHVILAALLGLAMFIGVLLLLVRIAVSQ
ncbi:MULTISPECIES: DUF2970 domain-containing protein [unclassified Massilia]|uniref:DUF2970 domain-containing protein n=1 Tax=unclassified Massilia TaxID=2609279 RepID=UPI0017810F5A|nr:MULTISPECIES: DUF2970 domain-containing protein [unclassified Massilia]MBD8529233.1 DUF2970 domain-containing protein [Massilia sp. CFBP 13647]MBD8672627.1 DUF2970 domain-containing protein [Massilia sp. CFBP 13721]